MSLTCHEEIGRVGRVGPGCYEDVARVGRLPVQLATRLPDWSAGGLLRGFKCCPFVSVLRGNCSRGI